MPDVSGSSKKLTLDGVTFRLAMDADINTKHGRFESELIATSGKPMRKMTGRPQIADGVDVTLNASELILLIALSNRTDDYTLSYKDAAGNLWTNSGSISIDDTSTQDGKATIKILANDDWEPFIV